MRIPDYPGGTLADVLPGALTALGMTGVADPLRLASRLEGVRRVAVLLVDGMGYHNLPAGAAALAPQRITCGFPSTTPTSLVSFATGVAPGAHGVLSFFAAIPGTERILNHVTWVDDPAPAQWQPVPPLYGAAAAQGIPVTVVNRQEYVGSGLTAITASGAQYRPAAGAAALAAEMLAALELGGLVYGYHPELDKAGHYAGLTSEIYQAVASEVDTLLEQLIDGLPSDAALIVTADHGQLDVPADRRIDLDALPDGVRVIAGEPRVRYLHTQPGAAQDVLEAWRSLAGHAAMVLTREEAIDMGLYGPVNAAFVERIGDVVMIGKDDWAMFSPRFDVRHLDKLVAMHGGLTEAEMDIPLFVLKAGSC